MTDAEARIHKQAIKSFFPQEEMVIRNSAILIHSHEATSDLERIISFLLKRRIPFQGIERAQPTLEDVFLRLTQAGQGECV